MGRGKSNRRWEVLEAITKNERASVRELCEMTGIKSPSNVWYHLHKLEEDGAIIRKDGARGIYLTGIIKRLKSEAWKIQSERGRSRPNRQKSHLSLQERINAVVEKAKTTELHDDAKLKVLPNGVKVIIPIRAHWVGALK